MYIKSFTFPDFYFTILIFIRYSQVHVILAFDWSSAMNISDILMFDMKIFQFCCNLIYAFHSIHKIIDIILELKNLWKWKIWLLNFKNQKYSIRAYFLKIIVLLFLYKI